MTITELKDLVKTFRTKGHALKTKKARYKAFDKAREYEHKAFLMLCNERDKYGPFSFKATVLSCRPKEEHFLVDTPYGHMWLSPTSDVLSKSWYSHTCCIEYLKGQTIVVDVKVDVNSDRLTLEIIPGKITGGTLNIGQYEELCKKDNLAFFKYPTGMSGLFKTA